MKKEIKIAFLISNLGQGGAEKQYVKLIKNLDCTRFDITVFLYACQVEPFFKELETNKSIHYKVSVLTHKNKLLRIVEAIIRIRRFLNSGKYDLVVTTLFMNNFLVRMAATRSYDNKLIANVRTSLELYTKKHIITEKFQLKNSYLVFNSKKTYSEFCEIINHKFRPRLSYIYNGFDLPENQDSIQTRLIFGSLGRLSTEKNILQAVKVFQEFEKDNPGAGYIVQGHFGNQYEAIKKAVTSANIEIREKNPDIETFYNAIKILILPSIFEGCPNVLFEALLRKKLCIVSAGANSDGFIQNGVNGFVYDGTDNGLLRAMAIVKQLLNTTHAADIMTAGYQYAVNNFSISSMVTQYEQLFLKIYEENKSRR
jgi:glycosyltransferase involved in cell wall biosynthesis